MDSAPDSKRPRLSTTNNSWSSSSAHHPVSLPTPLPHHPSPGPYQSYPSRSEAPPPPPAAPLHIDDRRHHDQEPYTPMQDHYRPPISPAHQPPPHYSHQYPPPRDPGIKREPDESMAQPRRPHSTGNVDGLPHPGGHPVQSAPPGPPHPPPPPPPPPPQGYGEDPRRHMSFDNSQHMPPTPGPYRAPSYPSTPIVAPHPYEHSGYPVGPPSSQDPAMYNIQYSAAGKRKATRASQACESCRNLKAKCDEMMPCKTCKEKGLDCKYRAPIQKQADKAQTDILDGMGRVEEFMKQIMRQYSKTDRRLTRLEKALRDSNPNLDVKTELSPEEEYKIPDMVPVNDPDNPDYSGPEDGPEDGLEEAMPDVPEHSARLLDREEALQTTKMLEEEDTEEPPGPVVPPGESKISANHTTLASLLLDWPSIHNMISGLLKQERIEHPHEFPIRQEQARGLIRVYGKGEGYDVRGPAERIDDAVMVDHGTLPDMGDDRDMLSDVGSSPHPSDWGQIGGLSPASTTELHYAYRSSTLTLDGNPDFSEHKVREYLRSFEEHILNMHPIIPPKELHALVQVFLDDNPSGGAAAAKAAPKQPLAPVAKFVGSGPLPLEVAGGKRKRSPAAGDAEALSPLPKKPGKPYRSMSSCLVLLVLALGKFCLQRGRLPDVVRDSEPREQGQTTSSSREHHRLHGSPMARNGHPASPLQGSPPGSQPLSSGLPSPKLEGERLQQQQQSSRRSSFQGGGMGAHKSGHSMKKNYDQIPGLEYFAYATDILGNQLAGGTLKHVWANILAGLYHGQLARPVESFAYIAAGSRALLNLIRPSLARFRDINNTPGAQVTRKLDNQLVIAFWTCLQLESDLLAEMPLIHSGILSYEENMPWPNIMQLHSMGVDQRVCESYMGQLYMRKHLNKIHKMFYDPDKQTGQPEFQDVKLMGDAIKHMISRSSTFAFNESDPPARDILSARLRAKYWGAQSITYRPFIKQLLQFSYNLETQPTNPELPVPEFRPGVAPVINPDARKAADIDPNFIEHARIGIQALVESTRAFHGLTPDERPIITNIFGTAHAQWGNLLVLAACYESEVLRPHIDPDLLRGLFQRTIQFFRLIANETSGLKIDLRILESLEQRLFPDQANRSFSSGMSSGPTSAPHSLPPPPPQAGHGHPLGPPPHPHQQPHPHPHGHGHGHLQHGEGAFAQPPLPGHNA